LAGGLSVLLLSLPAHAGKLEFWRFDGYRNRLDFRTESGVQPQAQLIQNPTRLVIDLPGVTLGRPAMSQMGRGNIQAVRVAQFDKFTTRIVVELAPGYTIDPNQVRFRGSSPTNWSVDLPQPIAEAPGSGGGGIPGSPGGPGGTGDARLTDLQATPDGLYLPTQGLPTNVQVERSPNRRQIFVNLEGLTLPESIRNRTFNLNRYGISRLLAQQVEGTSTPTVRMVLNVARNSPDWQASITQAGGVILVPSVGVNALSGANAPSSPFSLLGQAITSPPPSISPGQFPTAPSGNNDLATITAVDVGGEQLLIRADRPLSFTNRWERNRYRITIRGAQFSPNLLQPRTGPGSPVANIQFRQENDNAVSILLTPNQGFKVQSAQTFSSSSILVQLQRPDSPLGTNPITPSFPQPTPNPVPEGPLPRPSGRQIVVIDPGHGGRDPGAIGIGGIREADLVMDMSLEIARVLQQQGVIVRLTRNSDVEVDLEPRVALANRLDADVFVSIHANAISMSRPDINGVESFYSPGRPRSARLANTILNSILSSVNIRSRGLKVARFYVTRNTSMPSALIETGFVTGAEDAPNLANPAWRRQMARAIARGILQYLRTAE
jgi:N-acetylmuramoyl-L-alanine amidase